MWNLQAGGWALHGLLGCDRIGLALYTVGCLRRDLGDDPVLVVDDIFAEMDVGRRDRLAALIADCEQVIVTAASPPTSARAWPPVRAGGRDPAFIGDRADRFVAEPRMEGRRGRGFGHGPLGRDRRPRRRPSTARR